MYDIVLSVSTLCWKEMNLRLIFAVHRATHRIGLYIQGHVPGLNQAEAHILCHLIESGDSTIAQLHRAFAHKRSTLTSVLDRLSARKLVKREISETDRRSFVVRLTPAGRTKAARIHRSLEALEAEALQETGRKTVEMVEQVVERIGRSVH
jgi:DNA-binding MarR family transcriptional regulator